MNPRMKLIALGATALTLAAAGCGGDDEETSATGATGATGVSGAVLTNGEWIEQADEICASATQAIESAAQEAGLGPDTSPEALRAFSADVVLAEQQAVINELMALPAPEGDEDEVNELLDSVQAATDEVADDEALLADPNAANAVFEEADQLAADYGLQECGS